MNANPGWRKLLFVEEPPKNITTVKYASRSLAEFYSSLMTPSRAVSLEKFFANSASQLFSVVC